MLEWAKLCSPFCGPGIDFSLGIDMAVWILRAFSSIILGFAIFLSLGVMLISFGASRLTQATLHASSLANGHAYSRLYSEVLSPEIIEEHREEIFGRGVILTSAELFQALQTAAPPEYLQSQVELNLEMFSSFLDSDTSDLELYLEAESFLERLPSAMEVSIQQRVYFTDAEVAPPLSRQLASPSTAARSASELSQTLESVLTGQEVSTALPDLTGLADNQAPVVFDRSMATLYSNSKVEQRYRDTLNNAEPELRRAFITGGTGHFLMMVTKTAVSLDIESAKSNAQRRIDEQGRLDIVPIAAAQVFKTDEAGFQETAQQYRHSLKIAQSWSRIFAGTLALLALAAAVSMYRTSPGRLVRWLYWTLILTGVGAMALVSLAWLVVPGTVEILVYERLQMEGSPYSASGPLASEIAAASVRAAVASIFWQASLPLVAGIFVWIVTKGWNRRRAPDISTEPGPWH